MSITLTGRVLDDTGVGINNATVTAYQWATNSPSAGTAVTGNDSYGLPGYWSITNLPDAIYYIQVSYMGKVRQTFGGAQCQFNEIVIGPRGALIDPLGNATLHQTQSAPDQGSNNSPKLTMIGNYDSNGTVGQVTSTELAMGLQTTVTPSGTYRLSFLNNTGSEVAYVDSVGNFASASGDLSASGHINFESGTSQWGILAHANTASRTYTFPDVSGNVLVDDANQSPTFSNVTLTGIGPLWNNILNQAVKSTDSPTFANINISGAGWLWNSILNQNLKTTDNAHFNDLFLTQIAGGASSLSQMINQPLLTISSPTFAGINVNGLAHITGAQSTSYAPSSWTQAAIVDTAAGSTQTIQEFRVAGTRHGSLRVDISGNAVLNGSGTGTVFLGWDEGSGGVIFGNGNLKTVAKIDGSGNATFYGNATVSGTVTTNGYTAHAHPYGGKRHIESGVYTINAGPTLQVGTVNISFTQPFSSPPNVVASGGAFNFNTNTGGGGAQAQNITTTGFTLCFSSVENATNIYYWIAEGPG